MRAPRKFVTAVILCLALALAIGVAHTITPRSGIENYAGFRRGIAEPFTAGAVKVTFLGTTTLLFDDGKTQFLIDGFLSRPGLLASLRLKTDAAAVDTALATAGVDPGRFRGVIVSHSHADHALDVPYIVKKFPGAVMYGSRAAHQLGCGAGLPEERNRIVNPMDRIDLGDFAITVLPATHAPNPKYPGEIPDCLPQPAWAWQYQEGASFDFLVRHGERTLLFRGGANVVWPLVDTEQVDVLFISMAQVGTQDENFGRNYFDDAVVRWRPRLVIPMHWDDYFSPLSAQLSFSTPLEDDAPRAFEELFARIATLNAAAQRNRPHVDVRLLQGYDSIVLSPHR